MKDCSVFRKGLCTGCVGQAEKDWIGAEQCPTYQKYNVSGFDLCKKIIEGVQTRL